PLWLMDAGRRRVCRPRDSVRGRRAPAAGPRSGSRGLGLIRCMRLFRPPGLAPTTGAREHMRRCSRPRPRLLFLGVHCHSARPPLLSLIDYEAVGLSSRLDYLFSPFLLRQQRHLSLSVKGFSEKRLIAFRLAQGAKRYSMLFHFPPALHRG